MFRVMIGLVSGSVTSNSTGSRATAPRIYQEGAAGPAFTLGGPAVAAPHR
jgi:hypothetical protein